MHEQHPDATNVDESENEQKIVELQEKTKKQRQIEEVLHLFNMTSKITIKFAQEVQFYQNKIEESKTAPKKNLYVKKRNKVKKEFISSVAKRQALIDILNSLGVDENGNPLKSEGDEE